MGLETLLDIIKENKEQKSVEEKAIENNECPYDGFALLTNSKGERACEFCGRRF